MTDRASTYRRSDCVDASVVGDQLVLYHRTSGTSLVLNRTAARLWDLLESPRRSADLVDTIAQDHGSVEPEQVADDVMSFLRELHHHNAVVVSQ